jgi:hypothetical protein
MHLVLFTDSTILVICDNKKLTQYKGADFCTTHFFGYSFLKQFLLAQSNYYNLTIRKLAKILVAKFSDI